MITSPTSAAGSTSRPVDAEAPAPGHELPADPSIDSPSREHPLRSRRNDAGEAPEDIRSPAPQLPAAAPPARNSARTLLAAGLSRVGSAASHAAESAKAAAGSAARNLWSLSDLRTMLQPHGNDPDFLRMLRGQDHELASEFTLAQCREQLSLLRAKLGGGEWPGIEPRFRQALLNDIAAIEQAIHPLENGTAATGRAMKALLNMVHLWPAIVPSPLLANQAKTFAFTVAAATKAVVGIAGATLRPTADGWPLPLGGGELGRHYNEVHFYSALLGAIFLSEEMSKKHGTPSMRRMAEAFDDSKLAHAGVATACATVLIAPFVWNHVKDGANKLAGWGAQAAALGMEKLGFPQRAGAMRRQLTPGTVSDAVHREMSALWRDLERGRMALQQARRDFTDPASGTELTRTLNSQCTHLLESIARCTQRLDAAFHLGAAAEAAGEAIPRPVSGHEDFASKLALTLFATGITASTVYLIQPDKIGTVDLSADGAVVTALMAQSAWNRQATRQDAMERFKGMAATSMVMAIAFSADKLSKLCTPRGIIESSEAAPYYASLAMTAMAMTMPGPVARGAELAMNWAGGKITGLFKGPDGQALAVTVPSSPQELQQRVTTLGDYLRGLAPDELVTYEQIAGESIQHAIEAAGSAAAGASQRHGSAVSIEEIASHESS